ncbi:MAG TPA: alpha/beta hydrolase [Bryobacteraceae bacterium]
MAGLFTVVAWDSIFPDRRDSLVLSVLPIRPRTIFRAKLAAMAVGLGLGIVAVNSVTGIGYPLVSGGVRTFFAYWAATIAAGLFTFCALIAIQGVSAAALPYRYFLRVSNVLQVVIFFAILGAYFLTPGPSEMEVRPNMPPPAFTKYLPSFWFVGLFERWNGSKYRFFQELGGRALAGLAISVLLAAVSYTLAYFRNIRRIIEEPDFGSSGRSRWRPIGSQLLRLLTMRLAPVERAVMLFIARTVARSRQHRNLLAVFGGLALGISLLFAKGMLFGNSRIYADAQRFGFIPPRWDQPNTPLAVAGFVLLAMAVIGLRVAFSLPLTMRANWLLRITQVHSPKAYFYAVRRSAFVLAPAPVLIAASLFYIGVWKRPEAWGYAAVLCGVAIILVNRLFTRFTKMPFACAYSPGSSNLRMKIPAYGAAFVFAVGAAAAIERASFETAARTVALGIFLFAFAFYTNRRWRAFAGAPFEELRFEEEPDADLSPLRLSGDSGYGRSYRYLDILNAPPEPSLKKRAAALALKSAAFVGCLGIAGFSYEQVSEWRHPLPPRVGHAVDVGGRTLNYFCQGEGSPVVIFESGLGGPGIGWSQFQKEVAGYTRACWYDRAGYGWSDAAPFPHSASAVARDLNVLLRNAKISPPYVLVGFSFGGLTSRVFAHRYPEGVVGMVLVDSTMMMPGETPEPPYFPGLLPAIARLARPIGLVRLAMPPETMNAFEPRTAVESMKELGYRSMLESLEAPDLWDLPLIVLTAGRHRVTPPDNAADAQRERAFEARWIEGQRGLARLSTRGEQRVFPEASHNLLRDEPQAVLAAVRDAVARARGL